MTLFKRQKRAKQIPDTWQYAPYMFEPGQKYVLELNAGDILQTRDIEALKQFFKDQGIICHIIMTKTGNGIKPVQVKTFMQEKQ